MKAKIVCINLFEGGLFWENIEKFLLKEDPAILCLQEVVNGDSKQPLSFQSIARLRNLFPEYYYYFSPELLEVWPQGNGDAGNAIFSRFPIIEQKTVFLHKKYKRIVRAKDGKDFSHYPKNLQHIVVEIDRRKLHVLNLHGIWGLSGADTPERLKMSKIILEELKGNSPAVLMGDFNLKPNTQTIQNIEKEMTNIFKDELKTTFNMKHKTNPGYATAVVDMFFASPTVKVVSKACSDDDVSDHKPLVVTVQV
ncbi:MAG: endonuclease/exonuclease/phosphatase family protein [Patescibacteria group bacterium]